MVLRQTDKQRLTAALLGKKHLARRQIGVHGDGMGAGKIIDGQTESLGHGVALVDIMGDAHGNDLGVGGDLRRDLLAGGVVGRLELLVVVDIAVEAGMNDISLRFRPAGDIVQRMTVGFGDGPHRGPAGVRTERVRLPGSGQQDLEDAVPGQGLPQGADIVAQAADLGGVLVGKGQAGAVGGPGR